MELKRAALLGCGPRAAEHAAAYRSVTRGRLVAACARRLSHAESFAREHGIEQGYDDARQMLERERPDVLHIVTYPDQRVALMTLAAEHGVPVVIVEKPIAIQGEDWSRVAALASQTTTRFVVNTQLHFHSRLVAFRDDVTQGRIGEVRFIDASAGASILDQGVHLLELAHAFAGDATPSRVFAQMSGAAELDTPQPSPDASAAAIEFEGGVRAAMVTGEIAPRIAPTEPFYLQKRIDVYGSRGYLHWTMFGWERFTQADGSTSGSHDYFAEDELGQAALTDAAFALLDGTRNDHPTRIERSLVEFNVVLGAYVSALRRIPVELPCDPPDGLIDALRHELA